ncbi:cyclodeaminase/cyclohydrolase family protein [Pseudonocardia alni]|uniref:cyclodeaminase/cyclohydrolase family protein n=1 Tax=Pseudonocardia alni TaxID=33907 RepID=UPI00280B83AE|nr:cyclodeaminase/cyclohydrolase family protein [Pseudonocardia alni]
MTDVHEAFIARSTVQDYLEELAARRPVPGGGAAAAVHAAQAAALLSMVAAYTDGPRHAAHAQVVGEVAAEARAARVRALELADADADAFAAVGRAYAMPRDIGDAGSARSVAIAEALAGAAEPPTTVIGLVEDLIDAAERLLPVANRSVLTDVAAATEAARAAATTARLNVEVNLSGIRDTELRARLSTVVERVEPLLERTASIERSVRDSLRR